MKIYVAFWGALVSANVYNAVGHHWTAIAWLAFAIYIMVFLSD
jgi:hypothetical protein